MNVDQLYNRSLIRLLLSNALLKPIWILGIDRWVQNEVGAAAYGSYFSIWGLTLTAGFILDMGLTTLVQREKAAARSASEQLSGTFWLKAAFTLLYCLLIYLLGYLYPSIPTGWLWGIACIHVLNSLYVYLRAWVTGSQHFDADVWFSVLDKLLLIPACLLWLSGMWIQLDVNLDFFILLQLISLLCSVFVLVIFLRRKQIQFVGRFGFSFARLRMAFPYALIVLLMSAHSRLDGFLLMQWSADGAQAAGRYAAGYRLLDAANMSGYLVASFLLPYLSRHGSNSSLVHAAIRSARIGLLLFSIAALVFVYLLAPQVSAFLYEANAASVGQLLPILFGSILGYSLIHVYGTVLTAKGSFAVFQKVIAIALLLHITLSAYWIPAFGALGAARSALISQVFAGLTLTYLVHHRLDIAHPYASYLVVIFTSVLIWFIH